MKEKILIAGGSGLIGKALINYFIQNGYAVSLLSRSHKKVPKVNTIKWAPSDELIPTHIIQAHNHVINLAGTSIGVGSWSKKRRKSIIESRVQSTKCLIDSAVAAKHQFDTFINASAVGYYGNKFEEILDESKSPADDFLSRVCQEWENCADAASQISKRVVKARFGIVLSKHGGFWPVLKNNQLFNCMPVPGNGRQYLSWIHIQDVSRAMLFLLKNKTINGPVNLTSKNPITYSKLIDAYSDTFQIKKWKVNIPSIFFRLGLGKKSEMLLFSQRAIPAKLLNNEAFVFKYPEIKRAMLELEN